MTDATYHSGFLRLDERGEARPNATPGTQAHLDGFLPAHFGILARRRMPG